MHGQGSGPIFPLKCFSLGSFCFKIYLLPVARSHLPCGGILLLGLHPIPFPTSSSQLAFVGCSHGPNSLLPLLHLTLISQKRIKPSPPLGFLPSRLPLATT